MNKIIALLPLFIIACGDSASVQDESSTDDQPYVEISARQMESNNMRLIAVVDSVMELEVKTTGLVKLAPNGLRQYSSPLDGRIEKVAVLNGAQVKRGQLILTIFSQSLVEIEQQYLEDLSQYQFWQEEVERQQQLTDAKAGAVKTLSEAKTNAQTFVARVTGAESKLRYAGVSPEKVRSTGPQGMIALLADFDGAIGALSVNSGETVAISAPLFVLMNPKDMLVEMSVFAQHIQQIALGNMVEMEAGKSKFNGEVVSVGMHPDQPNGAFTVMVRPNAELSLVEGLFVTGSVATTTESVLAVPSDAIAGDPEEPFVLVKRSEKDGNYGFERIRVKVVTEQDEWTGVSSASLQKDDIIVAGSLQFFSME